MFVFTIVLIIVVAIIYGISESKTNGGKSSLNNIAKTEMMSEMYRDITGENLDSVEKSLLFMKNSRKK